MIRGSTGINGKFWGLSTGAVSQPAIAPSQVGGLTAGVSGTVTIPVSYSAPTGTGPITFAGRAALHGSTTFTPNNGVFSATSGQFIGLTAGTAYDLQIIATNVAGSSTTTLLNITTNSAPVVLLPSNTATRINVVFDQSVVAPGGTVTGSVIPNGLWPAATGNTVTLTPSSGSPIIIPLPSSGSAPVTFSFAAPSIGDDYFVVTNTAGLLNPWQQQINVFAGSSGTSRTFTATLAGTTPDLRTFQRDAVATNPTGFSLAGTRGWGSVGINIASLSGATNGIWMRPYDAMSSGASTTVGTGTALHAAVQVHGSMGASGTIYPLLPATLGFLFWDIATDVAFTAPVRIAQRCRVGVVVADCSRSQETGFAQYYADNTPFTPINSRLAVWTSGDVRYAADAYTGIHWTLSSDTSAGQEFARILEAQLGVGVAITGVSATGGGLDYFFGHDGTPSSAFQGTVAASCDNKFGLATISMGGWGDSNNTPADSAYPTESFGEDQTRMQAAVVKLQQMYPACDVIRWCSGASGWFGSDGSRDLGYTRINSIARAIEAANPSVVSGESTLWNEYNNFHATQAARLDYARTAARMFLAAIPAAMGGLGNSNHGPILAATAIVSGRFLRIPFKLNGGTALTSTRAAYSNPNVSYGTATAAQIASMFSVYAGVGGRQGNGTAIRIDSANINTVSPPTGYDGTVDLALTGTSGVTYADNTVGPTPSAYNMHYGADFGASNGTVVPGNQVGVSLCDDISEYSIPYGRLMRPALDIVAMS